MSHLGLRPDSCQVHTLAAAEGGSSPPSVGGGGVGCGGGVWPYRRNVRFNVLERYHNKYHNKPGGEAPCSHGSRVVYTPCSYTVRFSHMALDLAHPYTGLRCRSLAPWIVGRRAVSSSKVDSPRVVFDGRRRLKSDCCRCTLCLNWSVCPAFRELGHGIRATRASANPLYSPILFSARRNLH